MPVAPLAEFAATLALSASTVGGVFEVRLNILKGSHMNLATLFVIGLSRTYLAGRTLGDDLPGALELATHHAAADCSTGLPERSTAPSTGTYFIYTPPVGASSSMPSPHQRKPATP